MSRLNHAWCDHVVHVELYGSNAKVAEEYARFLSGCLDNGRDVFVAVTDDDHVEVRSELDGAISAADVAKVLAEADRRALSIYERDEWAVGKGER